jgi:phosphonate transport system substrate-binding protein
MRDNVALANELRIIDTFGPSPIQPVVAGNHLPKSLKRDIRTVLLEMSEDPSAQPALDNACIERFVPVSDGDYDPIRMMLAARETWETNHVRPHAPPVMRTA